jgi:probable F420-dependent oxidoreductase
MRAGYPSAVDIGVVIGGDLRDQARLAREVEDAGFESVWVAETARSSITQAAVAAAATERARVGTAVTLAFPRSPTIVAMEARDLAELSGGRFILGLGTQVKPVMQRRFGVPFEHPAAKVEEAIGTIREVWATFDGAPIDHRGTFYEITMPPFPGAGPPPGPIPIYLAGVGATMLEVAGRVADGVSGHPMTSPEYVRDVVRPRLAEGARSAGREPGDVSVTTNLIVQVAAEEVDQARFEAALQIGFYATTPAYLPVLEHHGFGELQGKLRDAHRRGDLGEMAAIAMPMVDTFALAGEPDHVRARLSRFEGIVDRVLLAGAWVGPSPERLAESHQLLLETFRPA